MKFKVAGETYEFDESKMLVHEARTLKHFTGFGLKAFGAALGEGDPDAIVGMMFLAQRRAGRAVQWSDFDDMNLADIDMITDNPEQIAAMRAAQRDAARAAGSPDPTADSPDSVYTVPPTVPGEVTPTAAPAPEPVDVTSPAMMPG